MSGLLGTGTPTNAPIIYSGLNVSTSQWNMPVPIFWGTVRLTTNAIDYMNFQQHSASGKGGGKGGGGKGQNYTYSADVLMGLAEGPIDSIQNIWANGSTTTTHSLSYLNMTFFPGTLSQAPWSYWATNYPSRALAYSQTAYLGAPNLNLGQSATVPDNGFECIRSNGFAYTRSSTVAGWINPNTHAQSNAVDVLMSDVITDFLTNPQYGMGWSSADLGSISQYAAYNRAQGIFVSPLLNSQEKATDILNRWAQITNSWIFWSGVELEFLPLGDSPITGNSVTFTPQNDVAYTLQLSDLIAGKNEPPVKITRKDPADCYNRTSVNITDRTLGYIDNPIQWYDDNLIDTYGLRDNTSVSGSEIKDPAVGAIVAQLIGKRAAYIRLTYEFKTSYRFIRCLPGTVLMIPLNYSGKWVRVRITDVQQDDKGQLSFTAEEFPGTVGTYVPPLASPTVNTTSFPNAFAAPSSINTPAIVEPPTTFTGGAAKIIAAASGQTNWGGCDVWLSFDGMTYRQIGTITAPAAQGVLTAALVAFSSANPDTGNTLAVDCTESGTSPQPVTNADAQMLRTLSLIAAQPVVSGGVATVPSNGELLAFGDVAATGTYAANLTYLERGQYGTAAGAHSIGDQFTLLDVLGTSGTTVSFDLPAAYIGQTIYLKFASFNEFGQATQDLSTVTEYQYTPVGTGFGSAGSGLPTTPTGFAGIPGPAQAALQWNANPVADNVTAFRLLRANGLDAAFSSATEIWQGQALNYVDTTTAGSTPYTYFLEALNAVGASVHTLGFDITTNASGSIPTGSFIFNETPDGTIDGTNVTFTLAHAPVSDNLILSKNGTILVPGTDYTLSSNTITMAVAPTSGSVLLATYMTA